MAERVIFDTDLQSSNIEGGLTFSPLGGSAELLPPGSRINLIAKSGSSDGPEWNFQCNRKGSGYFTISGSAWRTFAKKCSANIDSVTLSKPLGEPFYIIRVRGA